MRSRSGWLTRVALIAVAGGVIGAPSAFASTGPSSSGLDLTGDYNLRIDGAGADPSVAFVGDVNGDGLDDLLVGVCGFGPTPQYDNNCFPGN